MPPGSNTRSRRWKTTAGCDRHSSSVPYLYIPFFSPLTLLEAQNLHIQGEIFSYT